MGSLATHIADRRIKKWWIQKNCFTIEHMNTIDWVVVASTMKESPLYMQKFIPKWVSSFIAVGKTMSHRKYRPNNHCPRCGRSCEDTTHVLRCRRSRKQWDPGIQSIISWLEKVKTEPNLLHCIKDILS